MSDHSLAVLSLIATFVFGLVAIVLTFTADAIRNRFAALSERRARRRIDTLLARIVTTGSIVRDSGRFQVFMLHQILQALLVFAFAFFFLFTGSARLRFGEQSAISIIDLITYVMGLGLLFGGAINVTFALGPSSDAISFAPRVVKMVEAIERLRARYPTLAADYPDFSEVAEALAQLRAEGV